MFLNRRGSSFIELIVVVVVLSMTAVTVGMTVRNTNDNSSFELQEVVASDLAREGVEGLKNIIATNWLKFSYNKEKCWLANPLATECTSAIPVCPTDAPNCLFLDISSNDFYYYTPHLLPTQAYNWKLKNLGTTWTDIATGITSAHGKAKLKIDNGFYNYDTGIETNFYRQLKIKKINDSTIQSVCTVSWKSRGRQFNVSAEAEIMNGQ